MSGDIFSVHNDTWEDGLRNGRTKEVVIFPMYGPTVSEHFEDLIADKNLFQYDQFLSFPIDYIVEIGNKVRYLIYSLINNRRDYIHPKQHGFNTIFLPSPRENIVIDALYLGQVSNKLLDLGSFEQSFKVRVNG